MKGFSLGLFFGLAIATGVAIYHVWIVARLRLALNKLEAGVHEEAAKSLMFLRKKLHL